MEFRSSIFANFGVCGVNLLYVEDGDLNPFGKIDQREREKKNKTKNSGNSSRHVCSSRRKSEHHPNVAFKKQTKKERKKKIPIHSKQATVALQEAPFETWLSARFSLTQGIQRLSMQARRTSYTSDPSFPPHPHPDPTQLFVGFVKVISIN